MSFGRLTILLAISGHGRVGKLARHLFKTQFDLIQPAREFHVRLGDDQLAALRCFERHSVIQRTDRNFGLLV